MEWIAGDIGGTKSRLAWVAVAPDGAQILRFEKVYASADFASAEALLHRFVAEANTTCEPDQLILALPGPLHAQRVTLTNLDWTLDAGQLQTVLGLAGVRFINDFQAAAAGVATLTAADVVALNAHTPDPGGVRAITGAGTGLGLAFMLADADGRYRSYATEGGHIDFAPSNAIQVRLFEHLRAKYGHVSWERAASGLAMDDLYRFCCAEHGCQPPAETMDGAALAALAESDNAVAAAALDLFVDLYGAWVGNVALLYQPAGGLYIAGGVAVHLQPRMQSARFMAAAADKGRMRGVVERTPIFLITCKRLGVQGAISSALARSPHNSTQHLDSNTAANRSGT